MPVVKKYDAMGRMAFGKFQFEKFENVPVDYLLYTKETVDPWKLEMEFPKLSEYLKSINIETGEAEDGDAENGRADLRGRRESRDMGGFREDSDSTAFVRKRANKGLDQDA